MREQWEQERRRTTTSVLVDALGMKGTHAIRTARRTLQQLVNKGLLQYSKEATDHGQVVWFWPAGVGSVAEESPDSTVSDVSPVPPLSGEGTHRSEGIGGSVGQGIAPGIRGVARVPPHAIQCSQARRY